MTPHPGQQVLIDEKLPATVIHCDHESRLALVEIRGKIRSQVTVAYAFLSPLTLAERWFQERTRR